MSHYYYYYYYYCYYYYRLPKIRSTKTADLRRAAIRQSQRVGSGSTPVAARPTESQAKYQPRPPTSKRPIENRRTPLPPMRDTKSRKVKVVKTKQDENRQRRNGKNDIFLRIIFSYLYTVEAWFKLAISIPFPTYVIRIVRILIWHAIISLYTTRNSVLSAGGSDFLFISRSFNTCRFSHIL